MRAAFRATNPETPDPAELIEFAPADYFARAKMSDIFEREAPLEIDLGSGEGAFLVAMAAKHPEHNFLGVERLLGRVRKVCRMVVHHKLTNARLRGCSASKRLMPCAMCSRMTA
jgi:tRNA (guanine-N7-)-methyltransferase